MSARQPTPRERAAALAGEAAALRFDAGGDEALKANLQTQPWIGSLDWPSAPVSIDAYQRLRQTLAAEAKRELDDLEDAGRATERNRMRQEHMDLHAREAAVRGRETRRTVGWYGAAGFAVAALLTDVVLRALGS